MPVSFLQVCLLLKTETSSHPGPLLRTSLYARVRDGSALAQLCSSQDRVNTAATWLIKLLKLFEPARLPPLKNRDAIAPVSSFAVKFE